MEAALIAEAPREKHDRYGIKLVPVDPLATFDLRRFDAVRRCQAQQGRELSRCLRELRALRREPLAEAPDEPERPNDELRIEPERPASAANDDALTAVAADHSALQKKLPNEPEHEPDRPVALPDPRLVEGSRLYDIWGNRPTAAPPDREGASSSWAEARTA